MKQITLAITIILTASTAAFSQSTHTVIKQYLDSVTSSENRKVIFTYDSNDNHILEINHHSDNRWLEMEKVEYAYDNDSRLIINTRYRWYNENNDWIRHRKCEITYDSNDNKTLFYYYWDDDWKNDEKYKTEHTYNNTKPTMYIGYVWSNTNDDWIELEKQEIAYDDNDNMINRVYYYWNNNWKISGKHEFTYDSNDNIATYIRYGWDDDWIKENKEEYTYDNNGNSTMIIFYYWEEETNDWELARKFEYIFDTSYSKADLIMPSYVHTSEVNMPMKEIHYEWQETEWIQREVVTYHWSAKEIIVNK